MESIENLELEVIQYEKLVGATKPPSCLEEIMSSNQDTTPDKAEVTGNTELSKLDPSSVNTKQDVNFTPEKNDTSSYKFYPDDPESTLNRYRFYAKGASQFFDPCQESAKMSFKCLELNDYDRALCHDYFDAYRECKKQWLKARRENRGQWE